MRRICGDVHVVTGLGRAPLPSSSSLCTLSTLSLEPTAASTLALALPGRGTGCTCICPDNLSAEHEGLSSMTKASKGHPFPLQSFPTLP